MIIRNFAQTWKTLDIMFDEWEGQIFYIAEFFIGEPLQTVLR